MIVWFSPFGRIVFYDENLTFLFSGTTSWKSIFCDKLQQNSISDGEYYKEKHLHEKIT